MKDILEQATGWDRSCPIAQWSRFYERKETALGADWLKGGRFMALALCFGLACLPGWAGTWREDFSADPSTRGWEVLGQAELFEWNSNHECLSVTWDSSKTNSYFYRSLGTILGRSDDFAFAFDLVMEDIRIGVHPAKPYTFQLALGLINRRDATAPHFFRGAGINAEYGPRNLVEFSYFADSGFGETFAPTVVSTNNRIFPSHNHPLPLMPGDRYRIRLEHSAQASILRASATRNGEPFGLPPDQNLRDLSLAGAPDFRVDGIAVCSYNDGHQSPAIFAGSLLARGYVDNIDVTTPAPPVRQLEGDFFGDVWTVRFSGATNWIYHLERSSNAADWQSIAMVAGVDGSVTMVDEHPPERGAAFYRVRAER